LPDPPLHPHNTSLAKQSARETLPPPFPARRGLLCLSHALWRGGWRSVVVGLQAQRLCCGARVGCVHVPLLARHVRTGSAGPGCRGSFYTFSCFHVSRNVAHSSLALSSYRKKWHVCAVKRGLEKIAQFISICR